MNPLETISHFFGGGEAWLTILRRIREVIVVLNFAIIAFWFYPLIKSFHHRPNLNPFRRITARTFTLEDALFKEQWESILKRFAVGSADSLKLAVIDADKLADDTLKRLGLEGDHMADRLEKISVEEIRTLDRLWRAHRVRNELVHTPGYELDVEEAKHILADYRAFLEEVGVLVPEGESHGEAPHH